MKMAITLQGDHVATVFDGADELLIVEGWVEPASIPARIPFTGETNIAKVALLKGYNVEILICGALSKFLQRMLEASGIEVFAFIRGAVEEVVHAFYQECLDEQRFFLPGCCPRQLSGPRRRRVRGGFQNKRSIKP